MWPRSRRSSARSARPARAATTASVSRIDLLLRGRGSILLASLLVHQANPLLLLLIDSYRYLHALTTPELRVHFMRRQALRDYACQTPNPASRRSIPTSTSLSRASSYDIGLNASYRSGN